MTAVRTALGWSVHSGWAVVVGVRLDGETPCVALRQRVELISRELPRMAYHAAQDLPLASARSLLAEVERSVEAVTASALATTLVDPKTAAAEADDACGWAPGRAATWAAEVRKALGPPWQKDHKLAALAALVALQRS